MRGSSTRLLHIPYLSILSDVLLEHWRVNRPPGHVWLPKRTNQTNRTPGFNPERADWGRHGCLWLALSCTQENRSCLKFNSRQYPTCLRHATGLTSNCPLLHGTCQYLCIVCTGAHVNASSLPSRPPPPPIFRPCCCTAPGLRIGGGRMV